MRNANIPSLLGSPKRTAICDPGGSEAGPGFHFTSWLEITLCPSAVCAVAPAPLMTNARALTRRTETGLLIRTSSDAHGNCPAARRGIEQFILQLSPTITKRRSAVLWMSGSKVRSGECDRARLGTDQHSTSSVSVEADQQRRFKMRFLLLAVVAC